MKSLSEKFAHPKKDITNLDLAFGPGNIAEFLPPHSEIGKEFSSTGNKANQFISGWFCKGIDEQTMKNMVAKQGIDKVLAMAHIKVILTSFEPKHEHKISGCAYLLDAWFDSY